MKKQNVSLLVVLTLIFAAFTAGVFLGSQINRGEVYVSVPASMQTVPPTTSEPDTQPPETTEGITFPIDINTADREEFIALPGIGEVYADRIIAYREEHGPFENVEELMNVKGIGEKRLENMLDLITIGGKP